MGHRVNHLGRIHGQVTSNTTGHENGAAQKRCGRVVGAILRHGVMQGPRTERWIVYFVLSQKTAFQSDATDYQQFAAGEENRPMIRAMVKHTHAGSKSLGTRTVKLCLVVRARA